MNLFNYQTETRYDLNFRVAGIPVRVHPLFWLVALLLGSGSRNLISVLVWVFAVFFSLLIHELGHALVMRRFGQSSRILLYFGGGLTIPEQVRWGSTWMSVSPTPVQEIFISLAGALSGFLFAAVLILGSLAAGGGSILGWLLGYLPFPGFSLGSAFFTWFVHELVTTLLWINIFWGVINLMPVYPLDGGSIVRQIMLKVSPYDGVNKSLWISVIAGGLLAMLSLWLLQSVFLAVLFGLLAFQSYRMLQGQPGGWL
ncbi:MAG: site-2 protease family protein [Anaerolineales bacterium]|nr:site-2 protease family protein [Anaerolineales bacterium]